MKKIRGMQTDNDPGSSCGEPASIPAERAKSDDVERVLDHVSSSFQWELVEPQFTQPKKIVAKDTSRHK